MKKFLVLYRASQSGFQQMMKATPEQQQAGMAAWMAWSEKAKGSVLDMGGPLGKAVRVDQDGSVAPSPNDLGGFSVMHAESREALVALMSGHPHYLTPDAWIEIVDLMAIPGM